MIGIQASDLVWLPFIAAFIGHADLVICGTRSGLLQFGLWLGPVGISAANRFTS